MNDVPDASPTMSTYSVLPWRESNGLLHCLYFDAGNNPVRSDELDCHAQGSKVDFLRLKPFTGPVPEEISEQYAIVHDATPFAAVVKTTSHATGLSNTFVADSQHHLVLPVMPTTRRSTILIFMLKSATAEVSYTLIATADPEIKNSADGSM